MFPFTSSNTQQGYVWMSYFVCKVYSLHKYTHTPLYVNNHCTHICPPRFPSYLTSLRSGLSGLASSTTPELLAQVNSVSSVTLQTHNTHTVSSDLALIAKVWTENGRCEKIKCVSLTFTKGQLGLVPDLEIIFQSLHLRILDLTKAITEECLKFTWTYI